MKIKEVSQRTGLTKKTIRFYEAQGLLTPDKTVQNGREYRTYSETHLEQLQKIATLRRARFSVDEIRRIQTSPGDIVPIFQSYRERLREEEKDLSRILAVADTIPEAELTSAEALIDRMRGVAEALPLPTVDVHPHFRYLDDLEEAYTMRKKKVNMTEAEQRQRKIAATNAAMYAAFSVQNQPGNNTAAGGRGGGFDCSNAQKIAAYNMLMSFKDDE